MSKSRFSEKILPYLLILPSLLIIVGIILYPIILNFIRSVQLPDGTRGFDYYAEFIKDPYYNKMIIYTLLICLWTVLISAVLGYLLALYIRFSDSRVARWISKLYILPRFLPGLVAVNGVITIIRDSGLIARIGNAMGYEWSLGLMYDMKGIILMNVWFNIPFVALLMGSCLSRIQPSQIEAARDVGANFRVIFTDLVWPLTYRDLLIACAFVFMGNVGSFTTPYLMGENYPKMLGIELYSLFGRGRYNEAAALSVLIFLIASVSSVVYIYVNMKRPDWQKAEPRE